MSLNIRNLNFKYDREDTLNSISLTFNQGEITAIAGPNGSGKSTLLKNIVSMVESPKESIFLDNKAIETFKISERAKLISYVPQFNFIDFDFTVFEIIEMGRYPYKNEWNRDNDVKQINKAMELTDTFVFKNRSIRTLSGGELQRVMLARAIAGEPRYLILDEPASNLDISHNIEMMKLIKELTSKLDITTIIVLHDLNAIYNYCDKTALLQNGKVYARGLTTDVMNEDNIKQVFNIKSEFLTGKDGKKHIITI